MYGAGDDLEDTLNAEMALISGNLDGTESALLSTGLSPQNTNSSEAIAQQNPDYAGTGDETTEASTGDTRSSTVEEALIDEILDELTSEYTSFSNGAWFHDTSFSIAWGHDDNVLSSAFVEDGSSFIYLSAEHFAFQQKPELQRKRIFILYYEHSQYLDADEFTNEDLLYGVLENQQIFASGLEWKLAASGAYYNTLVDITSSASLQEYTALEYFSADIKSTLTSPEFYKGLQVRSTQQLQRLFFEDNSGDDTTTGYVSLGIIQQKTPIGQLYFGWQGGLEHYDVVAVRDELGLPVSADAQNYQSYYHEWEASWKRDWGKNKSWKSSLSLSYQDHADNGPGYADLQGYRIRPEIRYRAKGWTFTGQLTMRRYDYRQRIADISQSLDEKLERTSWQGRLRLERDLSAELTGYLQYERRQTEANRPEDNYQANRVVAGFQFYL